MKIFYLCLTNACPRRRIDTQKIYAYLIANGFSFTRNFSKADLIVICTCAVTEAKEDEAIQWIEHVLRRKKRTGRVIIGGCLPKINEARLKHIGRFETVSPRELDRLDGLINAATKFDDIPEPNEIGDFEIRPERMRKPVGERFFTEFMFSTAFLKKCVRRLCRMLCPAAGERPVGKQYNIPPLGMYDRRGLYEIRIAVGCPGGLQLLRDKILYREAEEQAPRCRPPGIQGRS